MRTSKTKLENVLENFKGFADENEVYPDPQKKKRLKIYKKDFQSNSTFIITTHYLKSLLSPGILALPAGFYNGGLVFSIFGYLFLLILIAFNIKRLAGNADHLSAREQTSVRTYDEVAYVSFNSCSKWTKPAAPYMKILVNLLFIITYLDACTIFMIFVSRNIEAMVDFHFPGTHLGVRHYLFLMVIWLMLMSTIRDLKYLTPFSFIASILLMIAAFMTMVFFFIKDIPDPRTRIQIGEIDTIFRFASIVSFSFSGISITLTLKSSMLHPEHFFSYPGVYYVSLGIMASLFVPFGFLGYLKYGDKTYSSVMLNLPLDNTLAICIKIIAIFSIFFTSPLVFYVAFNSLWNNYLKPLINPINVMFAEFCVRYGFITVSFMLAAFIPDLKAMISLKGALLHSHLEITMPALLDYVTNYPDNGNGKYCHRLIRFIIIVLFGVTLSVAGTVVAIVDLAREGF